MMTVAMKFLCEGGCCGQIKLRDAKVALDPTVLNTQQDVAYYQPDRTIRLTLELELKRQALAMLGE